MMRTQQEVEIEFLHVTRAIKSWCDRGSPKASLDVFMDDFGDLVIPGYMKHNTFCARYYFYKGYL